MLAGYIVVPIALLTRINDKRTEPGINVDLYNLETSLIPKDELLDQRLPNWAKWWDVGDEYDRYYGLNGDLGYQFLNKLDSSQSKLKIYWCRLKWLAFRNPANWFKYHVVGAKADSNTWIKSESSNLDVEIGDWSHEGWRIVETKIGNEYYLVKRYKRWPDKCFRARLGLKLGHKAEALNDRNQISFVCSIIPFKTYRGT